ncbi:hypothetical protein COCC4DRAFT_153001 [Bipolaris maydis ATCC 48331]|uniref:Uncharacterized protein n=2 Tax=Cochliobolus heterostrophus TaxID=5016 RepID=M2TU06_COCH5|nr:uncharacterized protein COCC4DRAFT_153001 [Bipolaris maydis ATCC 48331]EMD85251.1 hypothetical protein COCHEDRAFT_1035640 [Bipolaris maydis C5]KAJ5043212.1 hypothetical protein J3E74DRAFT_296221 [Bipolaris maydis]ENH99494.1 hypothetical protein COCC4DRAFT_153001 [Bipolaris maydis ATCC 48331]KAJ5058044.1 hypothetical protein J3E74DRAFT_292111 [Bipolaris maydis]KAJ6206060.1 hypothetical protein PSV09DRAFT_1035640 [Bipolaris maydis]
MARFFLLQPLLFLCWVTCIFAIPRELVARQGGCISTPRSTSLVRNGAIVVDLRPSSFGSLNHGMYFSPNSDFDPFQVVAYQRHDQAGWDLHMGIRRNHAITIGRTQFMRFYWSLNGPHGTTNLSHGPLSPCSLTILAPRWMLSDTKAQYNALWDQGGRMTVPGTNSPVGWYFFAKKRN